jgi:chemotaxis protein MotB
MDEKPKIIIVKRVKKGHGGGHGGGWKVAFADFMTAMMAFFLVMWLLSMVSPEKRAVMSLYFKNFSLFEHGGQSFMQTGGMKAMESKGGEEYYEKGEPPNSSYSEEELKGQLTTELQKGMGSMSNNVLMDLSDVGVRLQIVDTKDGLIFAPGSYQMTDLGKKVLRTAAQTMKNVPNRIVIEGHTDSSVIRNEQMSNWELSSLRACTARRELELDGIGSERVERVVGFANKEPLFKDNLEDPRNRRVSIIFLYGKKKQKPQNPYDWVWKSPTAMN